MTGNHTWPNFGFSISEEIKSMEVNEPEEVQNENEEQIKLKAMDT